MPSHYRMAKVDSLFAELGAFDSSSGVMFTTEDDTGKKVHWVNAALSRVSDATEEILRWLLADPLFILLKEDPESDSSLLQLPAYQCPWWSASSLRNT